MTINKKTTSISMKIVSNRIYYRIISLYPFLISKKTNHELKETMHYCKKYFSSPEAWVCSTKFFGAILSRQDFSILCFQKL